MARLLMLRMQVTGDSPGEKTALGNNQDASDDNSKLERQRLECGDGSPL
ncbi:MAG: hypothetical protein AB7U82_19475 [Blastocatellales bacterium]